MVSKILVLDALAGIWPHSLQLLKVVKQFDSKETTFEYVSCGAAAPAFCTVQESRSHRFIPGEIPRKSTCRDCKFTAKINEISIHGLKNRQTLENTFLSSLVDSEINKAEEDFLNNFGTDISEMLDSEIEGTPVVRFALYEAILKFKKRDLNFTRQEFDYFYALLANTVRFALIGKKFFEKNANYLACLSYAPQYGMNNAFLHQAHSAGVKVYFIDGNGNIAERSSAIVIWDWYKYKLERPALPNWGRGQEYLRVSQIDMRRIAQHKKQIEDGRSFSVYSVKGDSRENLHERFKISKSNSIWLMALSSLDEAFAAQIIGAYPASKYPGDVFRDQHEWVKETIRWVKNHPEITLIVRMHPRDLPNKRENIKSEQATVWEETLKGLPKNVILNHPSDSIAISDILDISSGFLTGWSSTALEAMDKGIPVVTYDRDMPGYPHSIHLSGKTRQDYFENLTQLTKLSSSMEFKRRADEWLIFQLNRGSVRLTGRFLEFLRLRGPKWIPRLLNGADILLPYVFRPFELFVTVRKTHEGKQIQRLVLSRSDSLYEVNEDAVVRMENLDEKPL